MTSLFSQQQVEITNSLLSIVTEKERADLLLFYTLMIDYATEAEESTVRRLIKLSLDTVSGEVRDRIVATCKKIQIEREKIWPTVNPEFPGSNEVSRSYSAPEGPDMEELN